MLLLGWLGLKVDNELRTSKWAARMTAFDPCTCRWAGNYLDSHFAVTKDYELWLVTERPNDFGHRGGERVRGHLQSLGGHVKSTDRTNHYKSRNGSQLGVASAKITQP